MPFLEPHSMMFGRRTDEVMTWSLGLCFADVAHSIGWQGSHLPHLRASVDAKSVMAQMHTAAPSILKPVRPLSFRHLPRLRQRCTFLMTQPVIRSVVTNRSLIPRRALMSDRRQSLHRQGLSSPAVERAAGTVRQTACALRRVLPWSWRGNCKPSLQGNMQCFMMGTSALVQLLSSRPWIRRLHLQTSTFQIWSGVADRIVVLAKDHLVLCAMSFVVYAVVLMCT
jgi:hypothetical protein